VVVTIAEHASNILPWTRAAERAGAVVRVVDVDDEGRLTPDRVAAAMTARTRVVAFTHVSNVLGAINPAREICAMARRAGASVVIDGAQGAPHVPIDVQALDCDFYVFSGHKMLGPMATGVVWGRRAHLDAMPPYHVGSNMAHEVTFDGARFEHGAAKYQAGTPDVAGPVGLTAAIRFFDQAGHDTLASHDTALATHGLTRLRAIRGLHLLGPTTPDARVPVFTFALANHRAAEVAATLDTKAIAVRAGDMAALPLLKRFGVTEAIRASAYVYSTIADLDRLADALEQLTS
jgi:cysteine desulfurase/selenocysteine lyase